MAADVQFNRKARIVIEPHVPAGKVEKKAPIFDNGDAALRFKWKHTKSWLWTPNVGSVEVFNLNEESRAKIQGSNVKVTISGGHGNDIGVIGTIRGRANHKHDGPTWETKIEGADGGPAHDYARLVKSYSGKTPMLDVVNDLIGELGMPLTTSSQALLKQALDGKRFKSGRSVNGYAAPVLRSILLQNGLTHTIQDEQIVLLKREGADGFEALDEFFEIGPDSGLVGSPEYKSPPHPGKPQLLSVKFLLKATIKVGSRFILNSTQVKGDFKVWKVSHEGDTHGGNWYSEVEGQALKAGKAGKK